MAKGDTSNPGQKNFKAIDAERKAGSKSKAVERDFCHGDCVTEGDHTEDAAMMRRRYDTNYDPDDKDGY